MERYGEYKDSGVEWIGDIPSHWSVNTLGKCSSSNLGKMLTEEPEADSDELQPYLRAANLNEAGFLLEDIRQMYFSPKEAEQYQIDVGDLIVVEGGNVALAHVADETISGLYIQNALHRVRPNRLTNATYLKYILDFARYKGYVNQVVNKATIAHFTGKKLRSMPSLQPPLAEQVAIASFLDQRTSEIDALIEETEKSVELLEEYRKSVISEAVTKGLGPDVPMKNSGIEWIGEVPEHWSIKKAKYCLSFTNGRAYKQDELLNEGPIKVLRVGNFNTNQNWYYTDLELPEKQYCEDGDLLYLWATTFGPVIWHGERVVYHYHIWKVDLGSKILKQYAYYVLEAASQWQELQSHGSTMVHITKEFMESSFIPIPSLEEQVKISTYLDNRLVDIDSLIRTKRLLLDKLSTYRKSLISEAVTGKIKVPGVI